MNPERKRKARKILEFINDLYKDKSHWTKGAPARNKDGIRTHPQASDAVCWSLLGAVTMADLRLFPEGYYPKNPTERWVIALLDRAARTFLRHDWLEKDGCGLAEDGVMRVNELLGYEVAVLLVTLALEVEDEAEDEAVGRVLEGRGGTK